MIPSILIRKWRATRICAWIPVLLFMNYLLTGTAFAVESGAWGASVHGTALYLEPAAFPAQATRHALGTGISVDSQGHVLTAFHVVRECRDLRLHQGETVVQARLGAAAPELDLALLASRQPISVQPAGFREAPAGQGEVVVVAGFPREVAGSGLLKAQRARISSVTDPRAGPARLRISAVVNSGTSGGPVLDLSGRVIGLVSGMLYDKSLGIPIDNPGVAVRGDAVQSFLRDAGVTVSLGGFAPSTTTVIANRAARHILLVECRR